MKRRREIAVELLLILFAACGGDSKPSSTPSADASVAATGGATLDTTSCPIVLHSSQKLGDTVICGVANVAEDRATTGRRIKVPFALFAPKARKAGVTVKSTLLGGPGSSWARIAKSITADLVQPVLIVEQRGAELATPSLSCGGQAESAFASFLFADPTTQAAKEAADLAACRKRLEAMVSLGAYTTEAMADDFAEIVTALQLGPVDVVAVSFGTRWALAIAMRHPEVVSSLVLDSVTAQSLPATASAASGAWRAIDDLFAACDADARCVGAHGQLRAPFLKTVAALERQPAKWAMGPGGSFTSNQLLTATFALGVVAPESIPNQLSGLIEVLGAGDPTGLDVLPPKDQTNLLSLLKAEDAKNLGQYTSVGCHDDQHVTAADVEADVAKLPAELRAPARRELMWNLQRCAQWPVSPVDKAKLEQPPTFSIPTLLLAGKFDTTTPRGWAESLIGGLPKGHLVELPSGHNVTAQAQVIDCASKVEESFWAGAFDDSCAKAATIEFE